MTVINVLEAKSENQIPKYCFGELSSDQRVLEFVRRWSAKQSLDEIIRYLVLINYFKISSEFWL